LRFEELCQWIKINGHDGMRRKVGRWADRQRELYKKFFDWDKIGKKIMLPMEERIEK
jgi:hypothetical protein